MLLNLSERMYSMCILHILNAFKETIIVTVFSFCSILNVYICMHKLNISKDSIVLRASMFQVIYHHKEALNRTTGICTYIQHTNKLRNINPIMI